MPQPTSSTRPPAAAVAVDGLEHERHAALQVPVARLDRDEPGREAVVVGLDLAEALRLAHGPHPGGGG